MRTEMDVWVVVGIDLLVFIVGIEVAAIRFWCGGCLSFNVSASGSTRLKKPTRRPLAATQ